MTLTSFQFTFCLFKILSNRDKIMSNRYIDRCKLHTDTKATGNPNVIKYR